MGGLDDLKDMSGSMEPDLATNQDVFRIQLTGALYQLIIDEGVTEADLAKKMGEPKEDRRTGSGDAGHAPAAESQSH